MVEIIRAKWCEDLEELIQCPICMNRPQRYIYQCVEGHHICDNCKARMSIQSLCPTCAGRWSASRNRLAEALCAKLDDIKLSLLDPEAEINKLLIPNRVSVASQTEEIVIDGTAVGSPAKKNGDEHTGAYPCRIGACGVNLFFAPLMKHIKSDHRTQFLELPLGEGAIFNYTWPVDYTEQMTFDRAFHVPGMGTFFLKLSTDVFGNFTGFILMLHSGFISKQFTYQLEISCCDEHNGPIYTGEVCSCRTPATVLKEKCLQSSRTEMIRLTNHEKQLRCTLLLGKKPQTEETEQTIANNQQKRYQRNQRGRGGRGGGRGQLHGPGNPHHPNNRSNRPQTAPNGQAPPMPLFPPPPAFHRSGSRPPSRTSSISSLPSLYPNLRDY